MKKLLCLSLATLLICFSFCGCNAKKIFETEESMRAFADGTWSSGGKYYIIDNGKIHSYSDFLFDTYVWTDFKENTPNNYNDITAENFYTNIFLENKIVSQYMKEYVIEYDYKKSTLTSDDGSEWLVFLEDGTAVKDDEVYTKLSDSTSYVKEEVMNKFDENINDFIFNENYSDLPSAKEVQYDKWGHFGNDFTITGTAELDDYYNWGYKNYEYGYFCINIRPNGGTYSDEWYVYADRNTFSDLYTSLQSGSKNVTLVAQMVHVDTGSNNMATLVDYKK